MILDLTQLRQDYKSLYRNNWPLAEKIKILIEVTKIEQRFQSHAHQAAKRIAISTLGVCLQDRPPESILVSREYNIFICP